MSIEINGHSTSSLTNASNNKQNVKGTRAETDSASTAAGTLQDQDKVSLTETASLMQQLGERISETPVVDQAKVASIRQALAEGRYEADFMRVAEKMMTFESALERA